MNHEEAKEVAAELAKALDAYFAGFGERGHKSREKAVRQFLWDNKIGISHVLQAWGAALEGVS